ncbi:MAG: HAMP domain-containing protein [Nitrospirae bacterium]|nr:HAMP domain-containing protein [Nitrospirota bacterium]
MKSIFTNVKFVSLNTKLMVFGLFCLIVLGASFLYDLRSTIEINNISLWLQKAGELRWRLRENGTRSIDTGDAKKNTAKPDAGNMMKLINDGTPLCPLKDPKARQMSGELLDKWAAVISSAPDEKTVREFESTLASFTACMQEDYKQKLAALYRLKLYMAVFFSFMVVLCITVARAIVTRPLLRIIEAVRNVAGGDFHTRITIGSRDEIGELARYFNVMTDALDSSFNEMEILASFPEKNPSPITGLQMHEGQPVITYINPAAQDLINADNLEKSQLIPPGLNEIIETLLLEDKDSTLCEIAIKDKIFIQYVHILNDRKTIRIFSYDITRRKHMEDKLKEYADNLEQKVRERTKELEDAKLLAEEASRTKSGFLANMSHELRTPLNSVIGFSQVLTDELYGQLNAQQQTYVNNILNSGNHLLALINEVLDLSRIEAGKMELERSIFRIGQLVIASEAMFRERAAEKHIQLSSEIQAEADINVDGDERRLNQVLYNLISNAIKFTPEYGTVKITARVIEHKAATFIETAVEDTGIGIREEDIGRLFTEFTQLDSSYTKKYEGAGLGLALSKKLIELHGGTIGVTSIFGKGSRFYFTIPVVKT